MGEPTGIAEVAKLIELAKANGVLSLKAMGVEITMSDRVPLSDLIADASKLGDEPLDPKEKQAAEERLLFYSADNQ